MEPRQTPPQPPAGTDDWKPGDLAECVWDGGWFLEGCAPGPGPQKGEIRVVHQVRIGKPGRAGAGAQFLCFAAHGLRNGYISYRFRKITPRADTAERGDAEWLDRFLTTPLKEAAKCDS